jgi:branched-subunit amino acid aminotransferase/4-amino-4-deoxychorismate lyase
MKAYRQEDDTVRLFRPDKNMARMNKSAARLALPVCGNMYEVGTQLTSRLSMGNP